MTKSRCSTGNNEAAYQKSANFIKKKNVVQRHCFFTLLSPLMCPIFQIYIFGVSDQTQMCHKILPPLQTSFLAYKLFPFTLLIC